MEARRKSVSSGRGGVREPRQEAAKRK